MANSDNSGTDWREDELDLIVADYFAMLDAERSRLPYIKAAHSRDLRAKVDRSRGAVERKHMNISAVLGELGLPTIWGYKPYHNYQGALVDAVERYIATHRYYLNEEAFSVAPSAATEIEEASPVERHSDVGFLHAAEPSEVFFDQTVAQPGPLPVKRLPELERIVRRFDPVARDFRNRTLGREGEALVLEVERKRLEAANRRDLAGKVRWVAQEDGDGAGYDIHSFSTTGEDRLIEVKTTLGVRTTPFFITRNELSLSEERPDHFRLYRLYEAAQMPRILRVKPPLRDRLTLEAEAWRASVA